jgi:hypothetical protein
MTRAIPMSEADWQKRITDYCDHLRLRWHHEVDSRRSKSGFPDLVIVGRRVLFAELKRENDSKVTPEQADWLRDLRDAGVEVHVWRPSDWPYVARRLRVLAGRR